MVLLMLIELIVLMIVSLPWLTLYFLTPLLFHGNLASNELLVTLLRFFGFAIFCQIYISLLILSLLFGARTLVLLICTVIQSFMLIQKHVDVD